MKFVGKVPVCELVANKDNEKEELGRISKKYHSTGSEMLVLLSYFLFLCETSFYKHGNSHDYKITDYFILGI